MTCKQKREAEFLINLYELRIKAIRSKPEPIDRHDHDVEAYAQMRVTELRKSLVGKAAR